MAASNGVDPKLPAIRSLPRVVEDLAVQYPDNTWITLPLDSSGKWRNVTYRDLANAVDGMLDWMKETLDSSIQPRKVVAYMGVNDMRYAVVQTALIKAGCKALLPSPRNSPDGQASLFKTSDCSLLLYSEGIGTHVDKVKLILPELQSFQIPGFSGLCDRGSQLDQPYAYAERSEDDQVLVLHTSGSTGLPKPIYHTIAGMNTLDALRELPATEGRQNITDVFLRPDESLLAVAPFFHMLGQAILWRSLFCRGPLVILSPDRPPNSELIIKAIQQVRPSSAIFPPSLLEEIAEAPDGTDAIRLLETVFFSGGPLATGVGEKLTSCTRLLPMMGSTEAGLCPTRIPLDKHDWQYLEWAQGFGATMEPDSDGWYEMVIIPTNKRHQPVFHALPNIREWRTNDLFERHSEKKNLWLYKGRKEDLLVLSNGEKLNPVGFEKLVESHPMVKGALVVGQARFQAGLLIEPDWLKVPPAQKPSELLDALWPFVEKANATVPTHGKVWKSKIAIAKREKPFKRAPKGSIVRRQTVDLYTPEIRALYSNEFTKDECGRLPPDANMPTIKKFLRYILELTGLEVPECHSDDDDDIFGRAGIDSLQVLALTSTLNHAIGSLISLSDVYSHPTINGLAEFIYAIDRA